MEQNDRKSEATGEIGEVYTTPTGMNLADVEEHNVGWEQISETERVKVVSGQLGVHDTWNTWLVEKS